MNEKVDILYVVSDERGVPAVDAALRAAELGAAGAHDPPLSAPSAHLHPCAPHEEGSLWALQGIQGNITGQ